MFSVDPDDLKPRAIVNFVFIGGLTGGIDSEFQALSNFIPQPGDFVQPEGGEMAVVHRTIFKVWRDPDGDAVLAPNVILRPKTTEDTAQLPQTLGNQPPDAETP